MRADSLRFSPPRFDLPRECEWALLAAFSSSLPQYGGNLEVQESMEWSRRLALGERIASRHREETLAEALDAPASEYLLARRRRIAGRSLLLIELARLIGDAAAEIGTPAVLLKGMAQLAAEITPLGSRDIYDVDLLVRRDKAEQLSQVLLGRGFDKSPVHESSQHLPALIHPTMGVTEIHVALRELRVDSDGDAVLEDLERRGLVEPAADPDTLLVPTRELLAAHTVAHGLAQHGMSPSAYPLLRVLADLQDLAAPAKGLAEVVDGARPFLRGTVSDRELAAVVELDRVLRSGTVPLDGDCAVLLRHAVAHQVVPGYLQSLKVNAFWNAVKRRDWTKISHRIKHNLSARARPAEHESRASRDDGLIKGALEVLKAGWERLRSR